MGMVSSGFANMTGSTSGSVSSPTFPTSKGKDQDQTKAPKLPKNIQVVKTGVMAAVTAIGQAVSNITGGMVPNFAGILSNITTAANAAFGDAAKSVEQAA
jgi:hypothetical protein